jgi:protein-S-isoprenylcysteine O-methyltransferase Ste14
MWRATMKGVYSMHRAIRVQPRPFNLWRRCDAAPKEATPAPLTRNAILFDVAERLVVAMVFCSFVYRMLGSFFDTLNVLTLLLIISEMLPFVFVMSRRWSAHLSREPLDWVFGIMGTIAPLLVRPISQAPPHIPVLVALCLALMIGGMSLQITAKVVLGHAFGIIAANRGVKVIGPYRFVRHPMYAGYTMTHIGYLLAMPALSTAILYALALSFQVARIFREERVLIEDPRYREFAARVRYRLVPGLF